MLTYLTVVLRAAELVLAIAFFIGAYGRYETDENDTRDRFSALWLRIEDARADPSSMNRYLQGCARLSHQLLVRIFGDRPISIRAIGTAFAYSIASYLFLMRPEVAIPFGNLAWAMLCVVTGTASWLYPSIYTALLAVFVPTCYLALTISGLAALPVDSLHLGYSGVSLVEALVAASLVDFMWIEWNRQLVKMAVTEHWSAPLLTGIGTSAIVVCTVLSPIVRSPFPAYAYNSLALFNLLLFFTILLSTRIFIVFVSGVIFLSMSSGLLWWCCRPVLSRLAYAAQRHGLQKALGVIASALFLDAITQSSWVHWVARLFVAT